MSKNTVRAQRMLKENEVKISKKTQNGKNLLFEVRFGFLRWLFGGFGGLFGGVGDLKILILAPEVPFLAPPNWLKWVVLANLGVPEMALWVPKSKF